MVVDLTKTPWPWKDNTVDEVYCCHFIEHLDGPQRITFFNELYRVMKKGTQARIIAPCWSHERAYGDPTHKFPPICTWTFHYLGKEWRASQAPHTDFTCDFHTSLIGVHDPNDAWVAFRNQETKQVMMTRNINTCGDIIATLTKQ